MSNYTKAQKNVIEEAKRRISKYSWYRGICLDSLPNNEICTNNFENAVQLLVSDTEFWDGAY